MFFVVLFDTLVATIYIVRLVRFKEMLKTLSDKGIKIQKGKKCKGKKRAKKSKKSKEETKEITHDIEANDEPIVEEEPICGNESIQSDENEDSLMIKNPVEVKEIKPVQVLPTPMKKIASQIPQAYPPTIQINGKTYVAVKVDQLLPNVQTIPMPRYQY